MADGARRKPQSGTKREQAIDDVPTHNGAWATPGFVLWHASLRWQQEATRSLARHDLTYAQFTLLAGIWWLRRQVGGVPPSQRELADHTGISPMMTSQVLRRLEAQQLVERVHDEGDTRVRRITLTDAGAALARKSIATLDKADRAFFADVALVERLDAALAVPIAINPDVSVCCPASIGTADTEMAGTDPGDLLAAADAAMYAVKQARRRRSGR